MLCRDFQAATWWVDCSTPREVVARKLALLTWRSFTPQTFSLPPVKQMKLDYYYRQTFNMHSHRAHTHSPTKYSEQNALLWSCEFPLCLSSSFPAPLPVALYQETLVDEIKEPAQHTLIFTTTLPRLSPHILLILLPSLCLNPSLTGTC